MIYLGIDPGINGACAALQPADHEGDEFVIDAIDLPTMADGTKRQINEWALASWIGRVAPTGHACAFIENVRAMPSQSVEGSQRRTMGAASSFRFGLAVGQIRATVRMCGIPVQFIEPRVWKEWFSLPGGDKEAARQMALQLWPVSSYLLKRKLDHQRAEAMLIAKYGARPLIGRNR